MSLLVSQFVRLNATIKKKTDQWGNQLAGGSPSGHFLELQGYDCNAPKVSCASSEVFYETFSRLLFHPSLPLLLLLLSWM